MSDLLSFTQLILTLLTAAAGGFAVVETALAGVAIISSSPQKKAEAAGKVKWIVIGTVIALSAGTLVAFVSWEISKVTVGTAASMGDLGAPGASLVALPGNTSSFGVTGWIISAIFASFDALLNTLSAIFWTLAGYTGPASMIAANIWTPSKNSTWMMGIFPTQTWSAMMYVRNSLYALVAIAALISFVIQGIQIGNAASSTVAKERAVTLAKNVVALGLVLGLTPVGLGLLNAGTSSLTQWILDLIKSHSQAMTNGTMYMDGFVFNVQSTPNSFAAVSALKMFAGTSSGSALGNSLFNLTLSIINLIMWVVYQWRRVVLAILITLMPLFGIGLVTGRRVDLIVHWWKEVTAYMLIPFVAALFLLIAHVFIGI